MHGTDSRPTTAYRDEAPAHRFRQPPTEAGPQVLLVGEDLGSLSAVAFEARRRGFSVRLARDDAALHRALDERWFDVVVAAVAPGAPAITAVRQRCPGAFRMIAAPSGSDVATLVAALNGGVVHRVLVAPLDAANVADALEHAASGPDRRPEA